MAERRDELAAEMPFQAFAIRARMDMDRVSAVVRRRNRSIGMQDRCSIVRPDHVIAVPSRGLERNKRHELVEKVLSRVDVRSRGRR